MGFMSVLTVLALLVIAGFVKQISKTPTVARSAALTAAGHPTRHTTASRSRRPKASPSAVPVQEILDTSSGLSYSRLSAPWRLGCPSILNTTVFNWSAGESAVAGVADIDGTVIDWHGNACSGPLGQQFAYSGPTDLASVTMNVADALEGSFYAGLQDFPTLEGSSAIQVSGHPAWVVTFLMTYPAASIEGLAWSTETGTAVVVDRGPGQVPSVFYASVPDNLGPSSVVTTLVSSLQLAG
jgi:hypothetical protein